MICKMCSVHIVNKFSTKFYLSLLAAFDKKNIQISDFEKMGYIKGFY